jgi:hypothetical protein
MHAHEIVMRVVNATDAFRFASFLENAFVNRVNRPLSLVKTLYLQIGVLKIVAGTADR